MEERRMRKRKEKSYRNLRGKWTETGVYRSNRHVFRSGRITIWQTLYRLLLYRLEEMIEQAECSEDPLLVFHTLDERH